MRNVLGNRSEIDEMGQPFSLAMQYIFKDIWIDLQIKWRMKVEDMYPA